MSQPPIAEEFSHSDFDDEPCDDFDFEIEQEAFQPPQETSLEPEENLSLIDSLILSKKAETSYDFGSDSEEDADLSSDASESQSSAEEEDQKSSSKRKSSSKKSSSAGFFSRDKAVVANSFQDMGLSKPIIKGIEAMQYVTPTKIQAIAIPAATKGKDICGAAVTGSGKTAAFVIPILERLMYRNKGSLATRVLILLPTRELAAQCFDVVERLAKCADVRAALIVGGLSLKAQEAELRSRPDIVVATPGRLIDHVKNTPSFTLQKIEILVLDEADRMLEIGFTDELNEIVCACPKQRQTMLFSATMTDNVDDLIRLSLVNPLRLFVDNTDSIASNLTQEFIRVRAEHEDHRPSMLLAVCKKLYRQKTIVFFPNKQLTHRMKIIFGLAGLSAAEMHGNLTQEQRLEALERFRNGHVDFLLATDVAARGIDVESVATVVNYTMPSEYKTYLHRVGRTARAGAAGTAVTLTGEDDRRLVKEAIKNSNCESTQRTIPADILKRYARVLEQMAPAVEEVLAAEREDKLLQQAEMEAKKAQNMIDYRGEIKARAPRTWFQSEQKKRQAKNQSRKEFRSKKAAF